MEKDTRAMTTPKGHGNLPTPSESEVQEFMLGLGFHSVVRHGFTTWCLDESDPRPYVQFSPRGAAFWYSIVKAAEARARVDERNQLIKRAVLYTDVGLEADGLDPWAVPVVAIESCHKDNNNSKAPNE